MAVVAMAVVARTACTIVKTFHTARNRSRAYNMGGVYKSRTIR
jgi:hypothetical protein